MSMSPLIPSIMNLIHTSPRDGALLSAPQPSPQVLTNMSLVRDHAASRDAVQGLPTAKDPLTPSRIPSPVPLPTPECGQYAFVPEPIRWSKDRDISSENRSKQKLHHAIKLFTDTNVPTYSKPTPEEPNKRSG